MKRLLKSPATNAVCISIFTVFYTLIFLIPIGNAEFGINYYYQGITPFWSVWSSFLARGYQCYIVYALIAVTALVVALLMIRRRPYDEYHTSILTHCLVAAAVFTLIAIAIFYLMILYDPNGIIEKFSLFIVVHWITVVFADLAYVLLCRWR